jgi:hypothetical protein
MMRKFAVRYLTGVAGARPFREHITRAESGDAFRAVDDRFLTPACEPAAPASLSAESIRGAA